MATNKSGGSVMMWMEWLYKQKIFDIDDDIRNKGEEIWNASRINLIEYILTEHDYVNDLDEYLKEELERLKY